MWLEILPLLIFSNLALTSNTIATGILNAEPKPWKVFFLTLLGNAARIVLPIGLALATTMSFAILGIGYTLHGVLIVIYLLLMFRGALSAPEPSELKTRQWLVELKDYGRPFLFLGIGGWLLQNVDRWILLHFFGEEQVVYFSFALAIGSIVPMVLVGALMQFFFPIIFRQSDLARTEADWRRIAKRCDQITFGFLGISLLGLSAVHLLAPHLVGSLIASKYALALPMIVPAGMVMVNAQIHQFYYLLLQGQHNSAGMVRVIMVVAAIKTVGGIVAGAISFQAFLTWLATSALLGGWIGRQMILQMALKHAHVSHSSRVQAESSSVSK